MSTPSAGHQSRFSLLTLTERAQQRVQSRLTEGLDDVFDQQRGLVVGQRDGLRIGEARVEIAELEDLAALQPGGEGHFHLAPPFLPCPRLLVAGDALGEPAWHTLAGHLQRNHVRQLVPERSAPIERARRPGARRVEGDHAAEARAECANHARQPQVPDGEVVVPREHLDEDWPLGLEAIPRRELLQRLLRQRQRILLHHGGFIRVKLHRDVAVRDRDELVERVEQPQQVERDDVVGVSLERAFERPPRAGFVAGSEQVHADVGTGPHVVTVQLERPACQKDGLVEAIAARRLIARHAVDLAVSGVDGKHARQLRVEVLGTAVYVGHAGERRARLEAGRIDGQRPIQRLAGLLPPALIELQLGDEHMSGHERAIGVERLAGKLQRGGGIVLGDRARQPELRARPISGRARSAA